ncbi:hypothetical protein [Nocardioides sp. MH1]|uniref:hypothetical protein n=1 Tax=Nocardioides sp. MH1 TaxID=3242490 RepID=UPI003520A9B0
MARTRGQVIVVVIFLVVVVLGTAAAIADAWFAASTLVIAIGGSGILAAMAGKPARAFGLTEVLLHRLLSDRAWRATYVIFGCCIVALGVMGLIAHD